VNAKLELGSNSSVRCRADGKVTPTVRWLREGSLELQDGARDVEGTMYFNVVQHSDAGMYTCIASSDQGVINVTIRVDVIGEIICTVT